MNPLSSDGGSPFHNEETAEEPFVVVDEAFRRSAEGGYYDSFYDRMTDELLAWRIRGAIPKSQTVEILAGGLHPGSVVEIGAGTGSVIARLAQRGFALKFYALETSPSAVKHLQSKVRFPGFAGVYLADSTHTGLANDAFDLGILSHVLEHVPDPAAVLRETMRICRFVVLEVPLEDSLLGFLEWSFRERVQGRRRADNVSGHIRFFNLRRIRSLIDTAGGRVIRERSYRPSLESDGSNEARLARSRATTREAVSRLVFAAIGPRIILANYGALVRRTTSGPDGRMTMRRSEASSRERGKL